MQNKINIYNFLRVLVGLLFVYSGFEKLISHYQNFLFVIQSYQILSEPFESMVAIIFPWIELILGIFLLTGLWLDLTLRSFLIMLVIFISVTSQALLRGLPIKECGCFGEGLSLPLWGIIIFDAVLFIIVFELIVNRDKTRACSLDEYFQNPS